MKNPSETVILRLVMVIALVLMVGILSGSFSSDGMLWAQEEEEEEEGTKLTDEALSRAKRTLQEMGMSLGDNLGRVGNVRDMRFAYSAKISDSQKALSKGFSLAEPRPIPVKSGTTLSVVIDAKGKVTFFVDSQNKLLDNQNQSTSIALNKSIVPSKVNVSASAFPSQIK